MSNRDPLYGQSNKSGSWEASTDFSTTGTSDSSDSMKDQAKHKMDDMSHKADEMTDKAKGMVDDGKHKAEEVAGMAHERADQGMDKAADSMDKAAEMLRQRGDEQGGTVGSMAGTAADAMESASSYLHNTDTSQLMDQLETYIRKNPTQSLLIGAGVGFILAKAFK